MSYIAVIKNLYKIKAAYHSLAPLFANVVLMCNIRRYQDK